LHGWASCLTDQLRQHELAHPVGRWVGVSCVFVLCGCDMVESQRVGWAFGPCVFCESRRLSFFDRCTHRTHTHPYTYTYTHLVPPSSPTTHTPQQSSTHTRPGFWKGTGKDKAAMRRELGVHNARTALVVGGGDGIGNLKEITESMAAALSEDPKMKSQVVVVCGKNEEMRRSLERAAWPGNVNVVVKGFVNNMDAWMAAADCIVTKAGPGAFVWGGLGLVRVSRGW
jgi:hypothetical protein